MSLYGLLTGSGQAGTGLVAALGFESLQNVGRYRDAWIEKGPDGKPRIALYTRNGGGNRECSCEYDPDWGNEECKHEAFKAEEDEVVEVPTPLTPDGRHDNAALQLPSPEGYRYGRCFSGDKVTAYTGKKITVTRYRCLNPSSIDCSCTGCTQCFRLPAHPLYLFDRDDDFDCTYATTYFRLPEGLQKALDEALVDNPELEIQEAVNMSDQWHAMIDALGKS